MFRKPLFVMAFAGLSAMNLIGLAADKKTDAPTSPAYVYTINNDAQNNAVAVFRQLSDGSITEISGSPFTAGGKGLASGGIDEQGAIRIHGHHVLAVNPGSNSIAVLQKSDEGKLAAVEGSPFPSGGDTPLSLTVHGDLVYVANQALPASKPESAPNIQGFRIEKSGKLLPIPNSKITFPEGQGPAQVEFSPDGKVLAVSSGFQGENTSRIHGYRVQEDGTLKESENSPVTPNGASGTVGFSWNPQGNRIFVTNFRGSAVITLDVNPKTGSLKQIGDPEADKQEAACWSVISKDGKSLYVGNFVSNSISVFDVNKEGQLKLLGTTQRRGATKPDTKDLALSKDGHYLYALGSGNRQVSVFKIGEDRLLTELPQDKSPTNLASGQNILGLVAD